MKEIHRHAFKNIFTATCPACGCWFDFTENEFTDKRIQPIFASANNMNEKEVSCPDCGYMITDDLTTPFNTEG